MTEKESTIIANVSHDENNAVQALEPELADAAGLHKSVALNIIENPLKVSSAILGPLITISSC